MKVEFWPVNHSPYARVKSKTVGESNSMDNTEINYYLFFLILHFGLPGAFGQSDISRVLNFSTRQQKKVNFSFLLPQDFFRIFLSLQFTNFRRNYFRELCQEFGDCLINRVTNQQIWRRIIDSIGERQLWLPHRVAMLEAPAAASRRWRH